MLGMLGGVVTPTLVTPEGWDLFRQRLKKAEAILIESEPYASSNPLWGNIYIDVGNGLGWPKTKILELFRAQAAKHKDYDPLYTGTLLYLTPKWGGSRELVDSFIAEAVKNTHEFHANSMYARLYWKVAQDEDSQAGSLNKTSANCDSSSIWEVT